jgi:hypothetical protein
VLFSYRRPEVFGGKVFFNAQEYFQDPVAFPAMFQVFVRKELLKDGRFIHGYILIENENHYHYYTRLPK